MTQIDPRQFMQMLQQQGLDSSKLNPDQLAQLHTQYEQQQGQPQPQQDPNQQAQTQAQLDPIEALTELILQYTDYATGIKNDTELDKPIQSQIMVQMAQSLSYLVPLVPNQNDLQMKQAELQMKMQEQQANLQFKQQELQLNMEAKKQEMQMKQQEAGMKVQTQAVQSQQKLQQEAQKHQLNIVQSAQQHEQQLQQQKQQNKLSQLNSTNNQRSNQGGKK